MRVFAALLAAVLTAGAPSQPTPSPRTLDIAVRGKTLQVRVYGKPEADPAVVWSGDGGWMHLGPHAAGVLARAGYFVVGVDSKQYLEAFTSGKQTVRAEDVPGDFKVFAEFAGRRSKTKPVLVGVSEGAGLAVLAASDAGLKPLLRGVVGLGLPDINELGWRWSDSIVYVTKGIPNEPTFSVKAMVDRVAPLPLAAIHATHDEFVPVSVIKEIMARAGEPRRLWILEAADHRFSNNERAFDRTLLQAMEWIGANAR